MTMMSCPHCAGFIPEAHASCPHCDAAIAPALARKLTKAACAGAAAMTLMACYGAGFEGDYQEPWTTSKTTACAQAEELTADQGNAYASDASDAYGASNAFTSPCSNTSGPERIFAYVPDAAAAGQAGVVTILWDSPSEHSVYVVSACGDPSAVVCGAPAAHGQIEMTVSALAPFDIVVDSRDDYSGDTFELQVVFDPM